MGELVGGHVWRVCWSSSSFPGALTTSPPPSSFSHPTYIHLFILEYWTIDHGKPPKRWTREVECLRRGLGGNFLKGLEFQLNRIFEGKTVVVVTGLDIAPRLLGHVEPRGGTMELGKRFIPGYVFGFYDGDDAGRWMFGKDHHRGSVKGKFSEPEEAHG